MYKYPQNTQEISYVNTFHVFIEHFLQSILKNNSEQDLKLSSKH